MPCSGQSARDNIKKMVPIEEKNLYTFTHRKIFSNLIKFSTDCSLTFMSAEKKHKYKQYKRYKTLL